VAHITNNFEVVYPQYCMYEIHPA